MTLEKLTEQQVADELQTINANLDADKQWQIIDEKLCKTFKFKNFIDAFGWMTQVAIHAEKLIHHPEWFNVYNRVEVKLVTHDVDGFSEKDFKLIARMEKLIKG